MTNEELVQTTQELQNTYEHVIKEDNKTQYQCKL